MPVHWTISHTKRLVVAVAKDELRIEDIEKYLEDIAAEGGMPYAKIFDMTQAPSALTAENFHALGLRIIAYNAQYALGPLAIVAASDDSYAHAGVYASEATADRPLRVFRELHTARQWLDAQSSAADVMRKVSNDA